MAKAANRAGKSQLLKLMAHLHQIKVVERYLPKTAASRVYGYTFPDGHIEVNAVQSIVDTVIHELLHSLYPTYSESQVKRLTTRLVRQMTDEEILAFYAAYRTRLSRS